MEASPEAEGSVMKLQRLLRPTNRRARVLVGVLLAALFCIQCTTSQAVRESSLVQVIDGKSLGKNSPEVFAKVKQLAGTDHVALLEYCLKNYESRFNDYTCTFVKQEKIGGELGREQRIAVKFMESPYSVAMKWVENAPNADRVLYVEGKYGDQMLARPTNLFVRSLVGGSVLRRPNDPEAMKSTLRPVNMFGFKRGMQSLLEVYRKARQAGDLKEAFGGFAKAAGRDAIAIIRYLPAKKDYPAHKTVVYFDLEYLVPIGMKNYDWDGALSSQYFYEGLRFNVALTSEDFLPKSNDLTAPQ